MITVAFKKKEGYIISFKVSGHAGYDEHNKDIVCSGVSVLAQATILGVTEVLGLKAKYEALEGLITIDLSKLSKEEIKLSDALLKTMLLGMENLELTYGEYINVKVEEV